MAGRVAGGPGARPLCLWATEFADGVSFLADTDSIAQTIEPALTAMGYRLVRVLVMGGRRGRLQIMAERLDELPMTVEGCAEISRQISALLDVADPIEGAYDLEVSSPGIDRPLLRLEDYDRFAGHDARIELSAPIDGRKRFRGTLLGRAGGDIRLRTADGERTLPFAAVARAKLVITDALLAAAVRKGVDAGPRPPTQ